jgi:Putative Ig domain
MDSIRRSKTEILLWAALILSTAATSAGCGSASSSVPPNKVVSVSVNPNSAQMVDQGQTDSFSATVADDSSNKGVTWTLTQNNTPCSPGCGTISPASTASGALATYTAPPAVNANLHFNVTATSVADTTKSAAVAATAVPPPALNNPASLPAATVGQPYSYQLTENGGVPPFAWSITSGSLPAGLSLNGTTGVISGTPTAASQIVRLTTDSSSALQPNVTPSTFTAQGCDSGNPKLCNSQSLNLLVAAAADFSLSASPNSLSITQGSSGTSTITVNPTGGFTGNVSFAASGLPNGLTASFNPVATTTTSALTLTASANAATGVATVTVTGTSGNLTHNTTISLTVSQANPNGFAFASSLLPDGKIGSAYNQVISTVKGTGTVTLSLVSGALPAGLSLSPSGDISGTPTGPNGQANFTLQAMDSSNPPQTIQGSFSISITDVGSCVFDASGFGPPNTNSNLKGTYVYRFQGFDANGNAVARVGQFTADGSQDRTVDQAFGHITGAIQDSASTANGGMFSNATNLADSTYCIGGNSNTSALTLGTVHYRIGVMGVNGGVQDGISFIEFDSTDNVRGSGVMRLQKATTIAQTGDVTYVFGMSGRDNSQNTNLPLAAVGQFTIDPTLLPVPGPSGLKGEEDVSEASVRGNLGPGFYRTLNASLNASTDSNNKLIPGRYTGQIAADPPTTPGDIGSGSIGFVAYVIKAASAAPTTNDSTELFAISTGTPTASVLTGEIVSQNFATNSTFNNSATPHTPDARAMSLENFYVIGGLVNDIPNTVAYADAATKSVALVGFVSFDGSRKPAAAVGNVVQLESDTDIAGNVQAPSQLPAPATYKVTPTGAVTFTGGGNLLPEIVLYLSDVDTGFAIVDDPQFLLAGFGRVFPSRNPGTAVIPVQTFVGIGDLPIQVPGSATTLGVATAFATPGNPITSVKIQQDVDDPVAGLVSDSQLGVFPITATDPFGRFTVGTCPAPAQNVIAPCFIGYYQFTGPAGVGALILDVTTAGFDSVTSAPSVRVWGVVP